jgi:hypothetical protein
VPSPKLELSILIFLSSLNSMMAWGVEKAPPPPAWIMLAEDETYEIQITFLPDGKGQKTTRQVALVKKDCEQNGNKSLEKEDSNSFVTVECRTDGNLIIRRSTLQPIGKLKQELNLGPVGTSRQEFLQGSDYYPDILLKVSRVKIVPPHSEEKVPAEKPGVQPGSGLKANASPKPGAKP